MIFDVDLEDMLTQNVSASQLKQVFKEQTGESVISYFAKKRIKEAKKLIQKSL